MNYYGLLISIFSSLINFSGLDFKPELTSCFVTKDLDLIIALINVFFDLFETKSKLSCDSYLDNPKISLDLYFSLFKVLL